MRHCRLLPLLTLLWLCLPAQAQDSLFSRPTLKVLHIGNSYTDDATALLQQVAAHSGADLSNICLYKAVRGSGSFKSWCDVYNNCDDQYYWVTKVLGGIYARVATGKGMPRNGLLFRELLSSVEWDLIILQQVSGSAPYYDQWHGDGNGGHLDELLDILHREQPKAAIGFALVHSYWDHYGANGEQSSHKRWQKIAQAVKSMQADHDIALLIPYGTAIENLRRTALNNDYDLTRDGTHLAYGLGRYTAACCYFEALIAPFTGTTVAGNPYRYDASHDDTKYPAVSVDDSNADAAQRAAIQAVKHPFRLTKIRITQPAEAWK